MLCVRAGPERFVTVSRLRTIDSQALARALHRFCARTAEGASNNAHVTRVYAFACLRVRVRVRVSDARARRACPSALASHVAANSPSFSFGGRSRDSLRSRLLSARCACADAAPDAAVTTESQRSCRNFGYTPSPWDSPLESGAISTEPIEMSAVSPV
eukprot:3397042-Pleurochrysis_carterae.AAC.2